MTESAQPDFRAMTADTIGKDLLGALVTELKLLPKPWPKLSESKQNDIIDRLRSSAVLSEWESVRIDADMQIRYGDRDYSLISESEKWRADAMIAEAIAHLSGVRILVLDRFDVLDSKGREDLLYWLDGMAEDGDIETALLFGTLKALPARAARRLWKPATSCPKLIR